MNEDFVKYKNNNITVIQNKEYYDINREFNFFMIYFQGKQNKEKDRIYEEAIVEMKKKYRNFIYCQVFNLIQLKEDEKSDFYKIHKI